MNYMNNMAHVGKIIQAVGCNAAYQSFKRDLQRDLQRDLSRRVVVMAHTQTKNTVYKRLLRITHLAMP